MAPRYRRPRGIGTAVLLALLPGAGCSWLLVQGPPPGPVRATPPVECTSSVAAPVVDTTGTVLFGATGLLVGGYGVTTPADPYTTGAQAALIAVGVAGIGAAVALGLSAAHGYSTTAECRGLREAQLSCVSGVETSCRSLEGRKP